MSKPIVFFSHSSKDKEQILAIRDKLDIEIPSHVHINDDKTYEPLETHPYITGLKTGQLQEGQSYSFERKVFQVTSFGRDFMKTCID